MNNIPNSVTFISGVYEGMIFTRGSKGRREVVGGITRLVNSKNFWYCGNDALDEYSMSDMKRQWVEYGQE